MQKNSKEKHGAHRIQDIKISITLQILQTFPEKIKLRVIFQFHTGENLVYSNTVGVCVSQSGKEY